MPVADKGNDYAAIGKRAVLKLIKYNIAHPGNICNMHERSPISG